MPCSICLSTEETSIFAGIGALRNSGVILPYPFIYKGWRLAQHAAKPARVLVFMVINAPKLRGFSRDR